MHDDDDIEPFYEWVKTDRTPSKAAAEQRIDGVSMGTVQERASDSFAAVGARWLEWLD